MTTSRDVLRMHVDMRDRLANPRDWLGQFVATYARSQYNDEKSGQSMSEVVGRHVAYGRSYHVEPNMIDLMMRRAEDPDHFTGIEQFQQFDPPFSMGFCVFGKPLETTEVRSRTQKMVAVTWGPAEARYESGQPPTSGKLVIFWTNSFQAPDEVHADGIAGKDPDQSDPARSAREYADAMQKTGGWAPGILDFIPMDARIGPPHIEVPLEKRQLAAIQGWEWAKDGTTNYARVLAALWELMDDTLSSVSVEQPQDRATLRFAKRHKIATDITTIKLRREARPVINPGSGTPLQYRVPVNGHNRTYHRGSPDEYSIWIRDHERGPKNAPYRANQKVYNLAR